MTVLDERPGGLDEGRAGGHEVVHDDHPRRGRRHCAQRPGQVRRPLGGAEAGLVRDEPGRAEQPANPRGPALPAELAGRRGREPVRVVVPPLPHGGARARDGAEQHAPGGQPRGDGAEGRPQGGHALVIVPGATHYNSAMSPLFADAVLAFLDQK